MKTYGYLPLWLCLLLLLLLCFYLASYVAVFSMILTRLHLKPVLNFVMIPLLWVSLEYIRSFLFTGFPWGLLGYSQFKILNIIQISDIAGIYGVSFLIALSNAVIFILFFSLTGKRLYGFQVSKKLALGAVIAFAIITGAVLFYGTYRIKLIDKLASDSPASKFAIIQGNIDQAQKWDPKFQVLTINKYIKLSARAEKDRPDIIVWPETATPFYMFYDQRLTAIVKKAIHDTGSWFLIGSPFFLQWKNIVEYYNSAYLISPDGKIRGRYDKVHLVPFGEYVPCARLLPFVSKLVAGIGDFKPGVAGDTVLWNNKKIGIQICYEIIFPNLSRAMVKNNAAVLVNITNDAWFGRTGAPFQHFSMAVFRAVENRRFLVRAANTGISGYIDPAGRIISSSSLFKEAVLTQTITFINYKTIYTKFGDIFVLLCFAAALLIILRGLKPVSRIEKTSFMTGG